MDNPFYTTGIIPERYFCDRDKETAWLLRTLQNKADVLLTSPRRMGKTQLIYHLYNQPEIKGSYYTLYVDIFPTSSLHELVLLISKEIYSTLIPRGKSALDRFIAIVRSLSGSFGYDPSTGTPVFNIKLGDLITPELTLDEIFSYLESAGKPCLFAIDEFQQIAMYPEKNVEAMLRSHIQKCNNCRFIFSGSNRHVIENMFNSAAKPFYNSAEQMHLGSIPKEKYTQFAIECFASDGKVITPEVAGFVYDLFEGHTYYVHNILHNVFAFSDHGSTINDDLILNVLESSLEERGQGYSGILNQLTYQQKEVLIAIAKEGKASGVTSVKFVREHSLKSPSSVQYAIRTLLENQILTYENQGRTKVYSVTDRFFGEWVKRIY